MGFKTKRKTTLALPSAPVSDAIASPLFLVVVRRHSASNDLGTFLGVREIDCLLSFPLMLQGHFLKINFLFQVNKAVDHSRSTAFFFFLLSKEQRIMKIRTSSLLAAIGIPTAHLIEVPQHKFIIHS